MQTASLEKANRINKAKRDAGVTISKEYNLMKKAKDKPKSRKMAMAAFCFHCFGGTIDEMPDPGWQQSIRECTALSCPLYRQRPYIKKLTKMQSPREVCDVPKYAKPRQLNLPIVEH